MNNNSSVVVSDRKSFGRKVHYTVVSNKQPERKEKAQVFELKYANISDDRAAALANSLAPEDQNEHQKPRKKQRVHKGLGNTSQDSDNRSQTTTKKPRFDNSAKVVAVEPTFIPVDMVQPDLEEPTKRQINGDEYRGSSLYRMRNRKNTAQNRAH